MTGVAGSIGGTFSCPDLVVRENDNGTGPKAYLNYLVFDRDFHYLTGGFRRVSALGSESGANLGTDAEGIFHEHLHFGDGVVIQEAVYVYIYLGNENETSVIVFFDDFKVEHVKGPVVASGVAGSGTSAYQARKNIKAGDTLRHAAGARPQINGWTESIDETSTVVHQLYK